MPHALRDEIAKHAPDVIVRFVGEAAGAAPPLGTLDPAILRWCEREQFVLVTNNRRSMPEHLAAFAARGGRMPGVFVIKIGWTIAQTADHLALVSGGSFIAEYQNQIRYLPIE